MTCAAFFMLQVVFEFYKRTEVMTQSKYSNCTVMPSKYLEEIHFHHYHQERLIQGPDAIINACDLMQNPGQTQIFHKPGQTRLTRTKCDPDDPTSFNRDTYVHTLCIHT